MIVTRFFQVLQEPENALEGEIGKRETRNPRTFVGGDEPKEQAQRIPVARDRGPAQSLLDNEMVDEESVEQRSEPGHGDTCGSTAEAAKRWKRSLAWASRSAVTVR